MPEAGSASGGISSHDGIKNDTDSDYMIRNPRSYQQFLHPSTEKKLWLYLFSRDSNCKAYNYHFKVAGDIF